MRGRERGSVGRTGRVHRVLTPAAPLLLVLFHPQTRVPAAASGSHAPPPAVLRLLGLTTPEEAVPWPVVRALLVTAAAHQGGDGDRAWDDQLRRAIARAREPLPPLSELLTDSEDVGRGEQPSWSNSSSSSSEEAWSLPSPVPSADTPAAVEHAQHSPLDSRVDASVGEEEEDGAEVEDEASSSSVDDGAVAAAAAPEPQTLAEQPSERGQTSPAAGAPIHVGSEYEADARTPASIGAERWSSDGGEGSSWSPVEWWSPPRTPQPWPQLDSEDDDGDDAEEGAAEGVEGDEGDELRVTPAQPGRVRAEERRADLDEPVEATTELGGLLDEGEGLGDAGVELALLAVHADHLLDGSAEEGRRSELAGPDGEALGDGQVLLEAALEEGGDERLLAREVLVEGADAHARARRHAGRRRLGALPGEHLAGRLDDGVDGGLRARLLRRAAALLSRLRHPPKLHASPGSRPTP